MKLFPCIMLPLCLTISCGMNPNFAGDTSETGNTYVAGIVSLPGGEPAANTQVTLLSSTYNPITNGPVPASNIDTTDAQGEFHFVVRTKTGFSIQGVQIAQRTRFLLANVIAQGDTTIVPSATLQEPGAIRVPLNDSMDQTNGYFYIPGTTISVGLRGDSVGFAVLDSVPAGLIPEVTYAAKNNNAPSIILADTVIVPSGGLVTLTYSAWKLSKRLYLNTTASGAEVADTVVNFPVLVRLNSGNFDFAGAKPDGSDIRFAKANGTPLPYEIEQFDASAGLAAIWVEVDTVYGNDSAQFMTMFWGNSNAASASNSAAVFDTSNGFQGVWHMQEPAGAMALDATLNHFDGTPSNPAPTVAPGMIGHAKQFDGADQSFDMVGTETSKLTFSEFGAYTVSAWVYADTLIDSTAHLIVGKGHRNYYLKLYSTAGDEHWEFTEFHDRSGWEVASYAPAVSKAWKYIVGVRNENSQYLYLDGQLVSTTNGYAVSDTLPRDTISDVSIGQYLNFVTESNQGFAFFDGTIDEVRISNTARSADWIKLCFSNQNAVDQLLIFK